MRADSSDGLTNQDRKIIQDVLKAHCHVRRAVLFGSRAMGTFSRGSDIDLALEGDALDQAELSRIGAVLEDSRLPYKVDLLLISATTYAPLLEHLRQHGKVFYQRKQNN